MVYDHIPHPADWGKRGAMGACFHQALSGWALMRDAGDTGWKVAVGVVVPSINGDRHIHAWLQHGERVVPVTLGTEVSRAEYYAFMGVERRTVRLINPRKLLRRGAVIDRNTIDALLQLWGQPWQANDQGGIVPK